MNQEILYKYIAMPMAIKVFKQDFDSFRTYKLGNVYMDLVESIIVRMQEDYFKLKVELISIHHLDVKRVDNMMYKVNKEIIKFTPEDLREMTRLVMSDYLHGDKSEVFERIRRRFTN